jgi:predicted ester cyclase
MNEKESVLAQWFERVWNERSDAAIAELLAPDGVVHGLGNPPTELTGPAEFRAYRDVILRAFPDLQFKTVQTIDTPEAEALLFQVAATHQGEFLDVPPTGRPVAFHGMGMVRVRDGQIVEAWNIIDLHACQLQLTR